MLGRRLFVHGAAMTATVSSAIAQPATGLTNLGMVGIKSSHGRYLQAHADNGELHVSNDHRNEEETWFIVQVDTPSSKYAFYNWKSGNFLTTVTSGCARSNTNIVGPGGQWILKSGKPHGFLNAFMIENAGNGFLLGGNNAGDDTACGGEVNCSTTEGQISIGQLSDIRWGGWWTMEPATTPSQGHDVWNTVGGAVAGFANKITPADVEKILAAIG